MSISFNEIGNLGHIGNQMFQYSFIQGLAHNRGLNWMVPPKSNFGRTYSVKSIIYNMFYLDTNIESHTAVTDYASVAETYNGFDKDIFDNCPDNVNLSGYFQSYKYFEDIEGKIRRDFTFLPEIGERVPSKKTLSIHVRRGDYLSIKNYLPPTTLDYYEEALDIVDKFDNAIVFSDDIKWCKEQKLFQGFEFSEGDPYSDMRLMSKCDRHIIANSTFSWWSAWMSKSDSVVCPKQWFGPALPENTSDGYHVPGWDIV